MLVLAALLFSCVVYILLNYYKSLSYWKNKGVKYVTPLPIFGNTLPTLLQSLSYQEYVIDLYKKFPGERYQGTFQYNQPILLLKDLNLIKRIFTKEFNPFSEHPLPSDPEDDTLWGRNLFAANGARWKHLRQIINPAFTTSRLRSMFELMEKCVGQLMEHLTEKDDDVIEIEIRDLFKRYSADTIASIAFGMESNSFRDRDNDFIRMGAELTNFSGLQKLKRLLYTVNPKVAKFLNIKMHPDNVARFFRNLVKKSITARENRKSERPDYIQHLLESRKGIFKEKIGDIFKEKIGDLSTNTEFAAVQESNLGQRNKKFALELTDDDITAQALDFFYGGFYSTASLMHFCIYELVANPEVQEKLRNEITITLKEHSENITYDVISKMEYLDMVISETLRKWPTTTWIDRRSIKPMLIEPENSNESPVYLEAGTICWIPVFAIQRDPKFWPNPEKFDPERFHAKTRDCIASFSFLPFGAGPRCCVGSRFAILEAKLVIFHIISSYEVVSIERSVLDENLYSTTANSIWFGFKKRPNEKKN